MVEASRVAFIAALLLAGCGDNATTLYRNSVTDAKMRVHVATFDADEGQPYNATNCEIARQLFQQQPRVEVAYWCEAGRYRK